MKKYIFFLVLIFILGLVLRLYRLGEIPVGLHRDEAFLGYNAYSILLTGKDITGNFLPLHLKSFLYSPAGYSYLSIPFIYLFGLSVFSVRFASALFGSLTILITYFLTMEIFREKKHKSEIGLLASLFIAVSPWNINLARTATENTIVVFLISVTTLLFFLWVRKKNLILLIASFLIFSLTLFFYQAPRAFLPFFIPLLFIISFWSKLELKRFKTSIFLFILTIIIPVFLILSSDSLTLRIKTVSIFSSSQTQLEVNQQIREDGVSNVPIFLSRTFHNKVIGYTSQFFQNYFAHFSFDFLFEDQGLPDRYRVPQISPIYLIELPFLLFGIWMLLKNNFRKGVFLLGWIFLVPVGSALTSDDVPNVQRTLIFFPALSIISAYGFFSLYSLLKKQTFFSLFLIVIIFIFFLFGLLSYLHQYYVHLSHYRPWYRQDGYKELVAVVNNLLPTYKRAVITDRESAPAIFFLFYSKYDPIAFQEETRNPKINDFDRIGFGKYVFSQDECPLRIEKKNDSKVLVGETNVLYVNSFLCKDIDSFKLLKKIKRGDNSDVFSVLKVK
ncbi:MAG: glycosyltransferase family 39 protein [Candidatus Levybacteria bacterium]|nr:glycosyltransferase family 39 protein [Candidatus Levybacteria bacterium]